MSCVVIELPSAKMSDQRTGPSHRRAVIAEILKNQVVASQAVLGHLLEEHGIIVTQSCISRDLARLGAMKGANGYSLRPLNLSIEDRRTLSSYARAVQSAGPNLTIVRTATGAAQRIALFLDRTDWKEVVATLSGDDTIFIATRNRSEQRALVGRLRREAGLTGSGSDRDA